MSLSSLRLLQAGLWHFKHAMSRSDRATPGEGPWWHVYSAEWCGCILSLSFTYHEFATVVSCCLPCGFHIPGCPPIYGRSSLTAEAFPDLAIFSQQPACSCIITYLRTRKGVTWPWTRPLVDNPSWVYATTHMQTKFVYLASPVSEIGEGPRNLQSRMPLTKHPLVMVCYMLESAKVNRCVK